MDESYDNDSYSQSNYNIKMNSITDKLNYSEKKLFELNEIKNNHKSNNERLELEIKNLNNTIDIEHSELDRQLERRIKSLREVSKAKNELVRKHFSQIQHDILSSKKEKNELSMEFPCKRTTP